MSYYTHNVYNTPSKQLKEIMPESVGENRSFLPDNTWVVLAYVNSEKHLDWIRKTGLCNFRTGTQNGSLRLNNELVSSKYLLLHSKGKSIQFIKLSDEGPRVFKRSDLLKTGYPQSEDEDKKKDEIYIVYRLDLKGTEELWKYYHWDIGEVLNAKGNQMAVPHVVKLSNLMLKAKRK
jgi:hypothetical protein